MELLIVGLLWVILALAVGRYAAGKGHSQATAIIGSLLFSPLIGFILVAASSPNEKVIVRAGAMKKCPDCAELVKTDAKVCRFCRHEFTAGAPGATAPPSVEMPEKTVESHQSVWPQVVVPVAVLAIVLVVLGAWIEYTNSQRRRQEERSAISALKLITTAQTTYAVMYPEHGYACDLASLGSRGGKAMGPQSAGLIDDFLAAGDRRPYQVSLECPAASKRPHREFLVTLKSNAAGEPLRSFCADETGVMRHAPPGSPCSLKSDVLLGEI